MFINIFNLFSMSLSFNHNRCHISHELCSYMLQGQLSRHVAWIMTKSLVICIHLSADECRVSALPKPLPVLALWLVAKSSLLEHKKIGNGKSNVDICPYHIRVVFKVSGSVFSIPETFSCYRLMLHPDHLQYIQQGEDVMLKNLCTLIFGIEMYPFTQWRRFLFVTSLSSPQVSYHSSSSVKLIKFNLRF